MAINFTLTGNYTLDETAGIQNGADGTPAATPRVDSDVTLATLEAQAADFYDYLFTAAGLNLSTAYPGAVGVAASPANLINLTSDTNLDTLGLTDVNGDPFDGDASGLTTTAGEAIFLWSDLANQVVLGKTAAGVVVFAVYMQPDGPLDANVNIRLWTVTFEPIAHGIAGSTAQAHDDAVDLLSQVYMTTSGSQTFNFNALPSGQNLFGMVGTASTAIVVVGASPVLKANGTYANTSDTINTSQGGGPTTIGVNNQMFNPGQGAFFTYVTNPVQSYLAGATGGLDQNEADDADNVQFGGTLEVHGAFLKISQLQGNGTASMTLTAYNSPVGSTVNGAGTADDDNARNFVTGQMGVSGSEVAITSVTVYNGTIDPANIVTSGVSVSIVGGVATITGLQAGYVVEWTTSALHDQVRVGAAAGSTPFDVGLFGITEGAKESVSLAGRAFVEDSGPAIGPIEDSIVEFATDATGSVTKSLNGIVGTDVNTSPYTLVDWTGKNAAVPAINGVSLTAIPNATGSDPVTGVSYWGDTNGVAGIQTTGLNPDTEFYRLTLDQAANSGAGSYTFTVLQPPPPAFQPFDFTDLPSGQNLFGIIASNKADLSLGGLLVLPTNVILNNQGLYTTGGALGKSGTINTSKGGGPVTIGNGNQMFDAAAEGAWFIYVDNPGASAVAGVGLNQNNADDADTIRFDGTIEVTSAAVEIVQAQGTGGVGFRISAYDLTFGSAVDTNAEARSLAVDPLTSTAVTGAAQVNITSVTVKLGNTVLEHAQNNGTVGGNPVIDNATINVIWHQDSAGVWSAEVRNLPANVTVEFETAAPHDATKIQHVQGKYDIGGFNLLQGLDTPDQLFQFTARATDGDGDFAEASWAIGIDGTGAFNDNAVGGVSSLATLPLLFSSFDSGPASLEGVYTLDMPLI